LPDRWHYADYQARPELQEFKKLSGILWAKSMGKVANELLDLKLSPKHGKGAVATKVLQNQKYDWRIWHSRLEEYFPSSDYCYNNSNSFLAESSKITFVDPEQEQPVRVVMVPKTLKTPRVIAVEPACMQYAQQTLMQSMVREIGNDPFN